MKQFNAFPNKHYIGRFEHVRTTETGHEVYHLYHACGDPRYPAEITLPPATDDHGSDLSWRQLHGIEF